MRTIDIIGAACTPFGNHADTSLCDLAVRAGHDAMVDASVEHDEIGALYLGNFIGGVLSGQEVLAGLVADSLGLPDIPCTKVEGACASGGIAFRHAVLAVACGQCEVAIAVGVEKMTHARTAAMTAALNCALDQESDAPSGLTFPGVFGMAYRLHAERYGTTREQVSSVVIKNKGNGLRNPLAQMGADLTPEMVDSAKAIADPLKLFDCCPPSDGAAAIVVAARGRASTGLRSAVEVTASVQTRGPGRGADIADLCSFQATRSAAAQAFSRAGMTPADLDFVELHDCFSIAEIIDSEDLGLMPKGDGGAWALEGRTGVGGDMPINASGGLLAKGHPVGATGLGQIFEAVQQLRGEHPNQVRGAGIGLTHNLGGMGVACTVNILKRPDV